MLFADLDVGVCGHCDHDHADTGQRCPCVCHEPFAEPETRLALSSVKSEPVRRALTTLLGDE